ncbi:hypothetical protein IWW34DRAFT_611958 [Fusarium oxysporum f. sp. albedinis]|nr:hypothetical protein IWW34DRAFT_611958 [Fusarium oxysporum f. sp. albedinis]
MQLSKLTILIFTVLLSSGEACKCLGTDGKPSNGITRKCCKKSKGDFLFSDSTCYHHLKETSAELAGKIHKKLDKFDKCCEGRGSDCARPGSCSCPTCRCNEWET